MDETVCVLGRIQNS